MAHAAPDHPGEVPAGGRLAAIDIGSNSLRLIVAETQRDGGYRVIDDEKVVARLGADLAHGGQIADEKMELAVDAVGRMKALAEGFGVTKLRAVATAAVRQASNGGELVRRIQEHCDLGVDVISSEEEARLAFRSVSNAFDLSSMTCAIVDIGGGSTEVLLSVNGVVDHVYALPLGVVKLRERFGACDDPAGEQFEAMRDHVRDVVTDAIGRLPFMPQFMFGTGGTFTNLASVSFHRSTGRSKGDVPFAMRGYELQRDEIRHMLDWLRKEPVPQRASVVGLNPDRADIIVPGLLVIDRLMKRLGVNRLRVHDRGIRDGLLLSMLDESPGGASRSKVDRVEAAIRFARDCRFEEVYSRHVSELCLSIFDQLVEQLGGGTDEDGWASPLSRELLECAALLHNVGYLINYSKHHKHSYHLIIHSDMAGFNRRELEVVANVARYHRRAKPKASHGPYMSLDPADREIVKRLASILRIADGLNRTHRQTVERVSLKVEGAGVEFRVRGEGSSVDVWGAERKSGMFEDVFGLTCRFVNETGVDRAEKEGLAS